MFALGFGLIAALCWGVHDILVRYVGQRVGVRAALSTVLVAGLVFILPVSILYGDWGAVSNAAAGVSVLAGLVYIVGCVGLYKAFGIGPVRLVAPIVGAYPILSIGWSAIRGTPVFFDQWLAVIAVVLGVAIVAVLSRESDGLRDRNAAIAWALLGAGGFAASFALGQWASRIGDELTAIGITRISAVVGILAVAIASRTNWSAIRGNLKILFLMGLLDATALSIVIGSGTLPNPAYAAVAASTFGVITILLAWAFLSEKMTLPQWGGVLLTFSAIAYLAI